MLITSALCITASKVIKRFVKLNPFLENTQIYVQIDFSCGIFKFASHQQYKYS